MIREINPNYSRNYTTAPIPIRRFSEFGCLKRKNKPGYLPAYLSS